MPVAVVALAILTGGGVPRAVQAQDTASRPHASETHADDNGAAAAFAGVASGTARQPLSLDGHTMRTEAGAWSLGWHLGATLGARWQSGPRGDDAAFATSMGMISGRREMGPGWLELRAMGSAEPAMGPRGYPLLFQTGETADGIQPLVDRQHPHELLMELSATYRMAVDEGAWAFLYVAPVGEPAIGPVAFPHRPSGNDNPLAPISHHFLDATHISYGVVTAGLYVDRRIQIELSAFNGHEPDQDRWVPEAPALNSLGGRITVTPGRSWAVQASFAALSEPEQLHPGIDLYRITLSATHHRMLGAGSVSTTVAWGRNAFREGTTPTFLYRLRAQSAYLAESALHLGPTTAFARVEWARKSELFPTDDVRHFNTYDVGRLTLGAVRDVAALDRLRLGIGASADVHIVPGPLESPYGERPYALTTFVRARM